MTERPRAQAHSLQRPGARYVVLAQALLAEIESGRYAIGSLLPTEGELCDRFTVSRHTVRQALRELRDLGVISARQGVGTLVRALPSLPNLVHDAATVEDLLQITRQTRMQILAREDVIANEPLASFLPCSVGTEWISLAMLRFLPNFSIPVAFLTTYIRPEFAGIIGQIETADLPIFRLIEQEYGQRISEIRQEITSASLGKDEARAVQARPGYHALKLIRRFYNDQNRLTQVAVARYPGGRFTHTTTFRLKRNSEDG